MRIDKLGSFAPEARRDLRRFVRPDAGALHLYYYGAIIAQRVITSRCTPKRDAAAHGQCQVKKFRKPAAQLR